MSKVLRSLFLLFFLILPSALFSADRPVSEYLDSVLEWSGHPVLQEKRIVRTLAKEYIEDLRKDTETKLERLFTDYPVKKKEHPKWIQNIRKELDALKVISAVRYELSGLEPNTVLLTEENFPETAFSFETEQGKIRYSFRNISSRPLDQWLELKLQGSFFLYSESGALLLSRERQGFPVRNLDISEIRSYFQEEKKRKNNVSLLSENGYLLFYFPNHNLVPFYILLISKILLCLLAIAVFALYSNRFWIFLKDQTRRTHKAEISFLRKKERLGPPPT
ncbi:hypothetical protein ACE5IS_13135 [Leptospira wolffii]|uniref:DUF4349 domain-containing protein n=1 Tax=Leptospira wolffii TaxID=409998 RepID=A0ABV5BPX7_9LEPT|nr:hypothetical protein [Leptospira wolffii]TGL53849.1 hypothetical protein EHQ61_04165 [Leptospira wolffii]